VRECIVIECYLTNKTLISVFLENICPRLIAERGQLGYLKFFTKENFWEVRGACALLEHPPSAPIYILPLNNKLI
jgi:hypothetical protein